MADITPERLAEITDLARSYRSMGMNAREDYLAAGFTDEEIDAADIFGGQLRTDVRGDGSQLREYEPTTREAQSYALTDRISELFPDMDDRQAYRYARMITGSDDPSVTFANSLGLADLTPLGSYYAVEEGGEDVARGFRGSDVGTMGMGALEAVSGLAGLIPGERILAKGVGTVLDPFFRRQADEVYANLPAADEFPTLMRDNYIPSLQEAREMQAGIPASDPLFPIFPAPRVDEARAAYLDRLNRAEVLNEQGVPNEEIFARTGIFYIPVRDIDGRVVDQVPSMPNVGSGVDQEGLETLASLPNNQPIPLEEVLKPSPGLDALRPDPYRGATVSYEKLPSNVLGEQRDDLSVISARLRKNPEEAAATVVHEGEHLNLGQGYLEDTAVGSNPTGISRALQSELRDLRERLAQLRDDLSRGDITQSEFDEAADALNVRRELILSQNATELYFNNPGEQLARRAQGDPTTVRMLSPSEALNPYLNERRSYPERSVEGLMSLLLPNRTRMLADDFLDRLIPGKKGPRTFFTGIGGDPTMRIPGNINTAVTYPLTDDIPFKNGGLATMAKEML